MTGTGTVELGVSGVGRLSFVLDPELVQEVAYRLFLQGMTEVAISGADESAEAQANAGRVVRGLKKKVRPRPPLPRNGHAQYEASIKVAPYLALHQ